MGDASVATLDYETAAATLAGAREWTSPAELQGLLCGAICAGNELGDEAWLRLISAHAGEDPAAEEMRAELAAFRAAATDNFGAEDFGFRLLLPSDERALGERVEALASWCAAFLSGFGLAGGRVDTLDREASGALADLGEIARADADVDEETDEETDEESEFAEIAEYVRMAALMIRETTHGPRNAGRDGERGRDPEA